MLYHSVDSLVAGHSLVVRGTKGTAVTVRICYPWLYNVKSSILCIVSLESVVTGHSLVGGTEETVVTVFQYSI